jgi:hypothetical protein
MQTKEPKLKMVDFIEDTIISRKLINKNGTTIISASKLNTESQWYVCRSVPYPKCAKKQEGDRFFYRKEIEFPYGHVLIQELKNSTNAMKKDCAQSLIDFHTKRITNITKLL